MIASKLEQVLSSSKLPTLPTVAAKLLQLTSDPDVELREIATLVQYDQALSAKILRTINSSYYSLAQPCPSITRALAYMGLSTVKSLVLGFSLVEMTRTCEDSFDLADYWRRCVYSAAAARRIAMVTGTCDPDEAFIAALMQDIGMLAMHTVLGEEYDQLLAGTNDNHMMLPRRETAALGFNHAEAGAKLGEQWRLPNQLVEPIRLHHTRGSPFGRQNPLVNAVILGYRISNLVSAGDRKPVLDMVSAMSQSIFHMTPEDERTVLLQTTEDARELSGLLEVHVGELPDIEALLADADDALIRHQTERDLEIGQPRRPALSQVPESMTDRLTGVGNREHFDRELPSLFDRARRTDGCLGLVLVATDRFTSLVDTLGAAAGDTALRAIAQRLHESVGQVGVVCRSGGEQFAVIIPGATRMDAARMAERARRHIERDHVDLHGAGTDVEAVQVTASIGVAALEPALAGTLHDSQLLIPLAAKALDAARHAGGNCVRIFKPRSDQSDAA